MFGGKERKMNKTAIVTLWILCLLTYGFSNQKVTAQQNTSPITSSTPTKPAAWQMFRHDAQHTGRSPYVGAETNSIKWKFKLGIASSTIGSSPAVSAEGIVYIGSEDENLYAIKANGTLKWKHETA